VILKPRIKNLEALVVAANYQYKHSALSLVRLTLQTQIPVQKLGVVPGKAQIQR
jgi:hypothetical protein